MMGLTACGGSSTAEDKSKAAVDDATIAECVNAGDAAWKDVVKKARDEGQVVMYATLLPEIIENLEKSFESAYPEIDLKVTRIVGPEIDATLDAEKKTGTAGADVVSHVNYDWMLSHVKDGYFVKPTGPVSAGPEWMGTDNLIQDVFQVSLLTGLGIAWRTDLVEKPPTSYEDLLDGSLGDGQIGIVNAQVPVLADLYAFMEDEFGSSYLKKLAAQAPKVYESAVPAQEALIAGEISVDAFASSVGIEAAKAAGAPVEFALPQPGWAPLNLSYMLSWASHPNAGQVLFNYMACDAGQEALAAQNISAVAGIPGTIGQPSDVVPSNLERITDPAFIEGFYPKWADTFHR